MSEFLTWLAASGERLTVIGLLLIVMFVVVYGVQKKQRWWVPGWLYTDCEEEVKRLEAEVREYVKQSQTKLDRLEQLEEDRRSVPRRRAP